MFLERYSNFEDDIVLDVLGIMMSCSFGYNGFISTDLLYLFTLFGFKIVLNIISETFYF